MTSGSSLDVTRGESPFQGDELPLAEAKLAAPRPRGGVVSRPRILHALDRAADAALTVVAAPAGYGKTTAVQAWCASREVAVAWVTLDSGDNDPFRLWRYVATSVDRVRPGLGRPALRRLSGAGMGVELAVDELMNGIAGFGAPLVVILDDLHTVNDGECLASVDYAVGRLPPGARVIAIARSDPSLRVAHRRARGALAELRADELAFTVAEAGELLAGHGAAQLEPGDVELLVERTEGWPAALALAGLWLRRVPDHERAVREFGGDHRFVADYLANEVIDALDPDSRSFLLRACVLGRFTAALCDAALDRSDSAALLTEAEASNLFVVRLAHGGWYRIHALFTEFGRFRLASDDPGAANEIHERAAAWLRERGLHVEAAEHAAAAGNHELVAELLVEHHLRLVRNGAARTFLRLVDALPDEQIVSHPELAVAAATAATQLGEGSVKRRRYLELARRARTEHPDRITIYVEAVEAMVRAAAVDGNVGEAVLQGRRAVQAARAGADDVVLAAEAGLGRALFFAGDLDDAWDAALRAIEHPDADRRPTGQAFARSTLALVAVERRDLGSARRHAERAKALVGGVGFSRSWIGANASVALGRVLAAEGNLGEAERELASAERFFGDDVPTVHYAWLLTLLAGVRCRRGRLGEAAETLGRARDEAGRLADGGRIAALVVDVERDLEEAAGRAERGEMLERPSGAELSVLRLLDSDLSIRQIAARLFLSHNTVRTHTRAIYRKLGVNSRPEAVARAQSLGLLETQSPM